MVISVDDINTIAQADFHFKRAAHNQYSTMIASRLHFNYLMALSYDGISDFV